MELSYGKVKKLPKQINSTRNLYLRQQFGVKMLDLLKNGKRILNVDETWIGQTNHTRSVWRSSNKNGSMTANTVAPRISMIVGIDNWGDLYLSLHQTNTN